MKVRRLFVPLLVVLSFVMAACGSPAGGGTGSAPANGTASNAASGSTASAGTASNAAAPSNGQTVNFRMAWWGSKDRHDRTIKVINLFEKENPNVKITYEFASFNDYFTKMTTEAAGHNLPCLMQQDYATIGDWISRGLLLPLDQYVQNSTIDTKNVAKTYLDSGRVR